MVYKALVAVQRAFEYCIEGSKNYKISKEGFLEESETGECGIRFIYANWDKIKFKKVVGDKESEARISKLKFLRSMKKDEIFCSKWLVIPCFLRDIDWSKVNSGKIFKDEINDMYSKLISLTRDLHGSGMNMDYYTIKTDNLVQHTLVQVYDYQIGMLNQKEGIIKQYLLGKRIDYSTRSVISCKGFGPTFKADPIKFGYAGVPLAQVMVAFYPFLLRELLTKFGNIFNNLKTMVDNKTEVIYTVHEDAYLDYQSKEIEKRCKQFMRSPESRTDPILIRLTNNKYLPISSNNLKFEDARLVTWLDIIYPAMFDICKNKHVYVTRYPMDSLNNIFAARIHILTTVKTQYVKLGDGTEFFHYPKIDSSMDYLDTVTMSNAYLAAIGGDFDGTRY